MSNLSDFADWFKARRVPVKKWYRDGVGRWAFRVTVDGTDFVCVARNTGPKGGTTSIMKRVAGRAQTRDALILLLLPDGMYVFDPVAVLAHGEEDKVAEDERRERGEKWVKVPITIACDFDEWYDGHAEPASYAEVDAYR